MDVEKEGMKGREQVLGGQHKWLRGEGDGGISDN